MSDVRLLDHSYAFVCQVCVTELQLCLCVSGVHYCTLCPFVSGVRYVKDLLSGQCFSMALFQDTFDARFNAAAYLVNGSYVMQMKNPITFFFLDSNFTYSGQVSFFRGVFNDPIP